MSDFCVRHMWNTLTQGPCCRCMDSNEKIAFVWTQMRAMWETGEHAPMHCPYCLRTVPVGDDMCCGTLRRAVRAITERENAVDGLMEQAARN